MMRPDFVEITRQAQRDGRLVVPACLDAAQKHPCVPWKALQTRRPTRAEKKFWLQRYPHRNGLYLTGRSSGFFTVDADGLAPFDWLINQGVPLTQTRRTKRGAHLDFAYPADFEVLNSASKIYPGIDIRGRGGVAMAVGSVHPSGFVYRWAAGLTPQDVPLAPAPAWLISWLKGEAERKTGSAPVIMQPVVFNGIVRPWAQAAVDGELARLAEAAEGTRNDTLVRVAFKLGQLVGGGELESNEIRDALLQIAGQWPDLRKSTDTIDRALEAGVDAPRWRPL